MTYSLLKLEQLKRLVNSLYKEQKAYIKRRDSGRASSCKLEIDCRHLDELVSLIYATVIDMGFQNIIYDNTNVGGHDHKK